MFDPVFEFEPQSGIPGDANITQLSGRSSQQNVSFGNQVDPYLYDVDSTMDPTRMLQDTDDTNIENFFSRPVKIYETSWGTGALVTDDFDPWSLYFENPRVSNKIANFNLLRANLRLKVVINGNGFMYGRAIFAYQPFQVYDDLSTHTGLITGDLVQTSQLPHVFLDPTTSTGGDLKLPMFHYNNYIEIPTSQWNELGRVYIRTLNSLEHANGASDQVTISVFAWSEDVRLSIPTSVDPDTLSPQSGFESQMGEIDEANKTGVVSGPATAVAKWTSFLMKVPYIGPFATATNIAATATANVARIFGYSRPPVTKSPEPYKPTCASSFALTNVPDTAQKLTVDDKQELTIDPRIAGLGGGDPMNIREIAKRESFLTKFSWNIGTATETLLWNARVDPVTWDTDTTGLDTSYHFPACAFAALPFQYWTGSMRFRFQIVCSTFHKGRLKIVYDPNFLDGTEYNINYLRIVDIADETDFTIEVGNGQPRTLLDHHLPGVDSVTQMYSSTAYTAKEAGNGVIGVYVVNELTTPNSTVTSDIEVNVFVSMGDDFEVFVPDPYFQQFTFSPFLPVGGDPIDPPLPSQSGFESQSGEIVPESQNTMEAGAPVQDSADSVGPGLSSDSNVNLVYNGEAIASFRTLLKRYNFWYVMPVNSTGRRTVTGRLPQFPFLRGTVPDAVGLNQAIPYNVCNTVLLHWVRNAFQGMRGSIRYKFVPNSDNDPANSYAVERAPYYETSTTYAFDTINTEASADPDTMRLIALYQTPTLGFPDQTCRLSGTSGMALTTGHVNNVLEAEVPFYMPIRFSPGKPASYTGSMGKQPPGFDYRFVMVNDQSSSSIDTYVASGEDFQVYFFTGLPRMYYEPIP
jgi:hypothetical protein